VDAAAPPLVLALNPGESAAMLDRCVTALGQALEPIQKARCVCGGGVDVGVGGHVSMCV